MAIDQIKTINELERLPQVEGSNAFAVSTGGATGSVTVNQILEYMKQYFESSSNKSNTLTESDSQYPNCNAVFKETTRIINIVQNKAPGYPNWAGISMPVNATFTVNEPGLLFIESSRNNGIGYVTINGFQMIYGSGNGYATDYYCVTYLVGVGDVVQTTGTTGRVILFVFKPRV